MSARPGHDLGDLIKWTARDEWRSHVDDVMAEHFGPAMDAFGLEFEAIDEALGGNWGRTLWGCAFEDFLTRRFAPDDQNPVEAYLRRRGWKEPVATRAYMTTLQVSVMSLYEVSGVVPGKSLRLRDLVRGGELVLVTERSATQTLKDWDRVAARVIPQADGRVLAGGLLAFTLEGSQHLLAQLRERTSQPSGKRRGAKPASDALDRWNGSDDDLRRAAPLFSNAWLFDVLPRALQTDPPTVLNSDGDEVVFHTLNFPMAPGTMPDEVERRLNAIPQLQQETPTFWNWLGNASPKRAHARGQKVVIWNITMDDGSVVLGNVELQARMVALSVSSASRAERGRVLLAEALGTLVAQPLTEIQTVEQMRAAPPRSSNQPEEPIPPEVQAELVHDMLDRQYRALLSEPIPMLGDLSPRAAAKSARGRKNLAVWLKHLENQSRHAEDRGDPMATYDFGWMWRELKTYAALARLFARACTRAGIRAPWVTPHSLRHTHATRMWEMGMRELTLQRRLGHASPESTRLYTRVSDPQVVAEYRRALGLDAPPGDGQPEGAGR